MKSEFLDHIQQAKTIVSDWPEWKVSLLGTTSKKGRIREKPAAQKSVRLAANQTHHVKKQP